MSERRIPAGRRLAVAASMGLPCGQISGWPSISSRRASTRGEMAPCRRIASSSDSAQPSPTTLLRSHSTSACRRKIASAAARPAVVRWRSRPPSMWSTRPSATSRRNISLAACPVTPRWRATPAAVTFEEPSPAPAHDAQGEQVLLGGGGQIALVLTTGHGLRIRDRVPRRRSSVDSARRPARAAATRARRRRRCPRPRR